MCPWLYRAEKAPYSESDGQNPLPTGPGAKLTEYLKSDARPVASVMAHTCEPFAASANDLLSRRVTTVIADSQTFVIADHKQSPRVLARILLAAFERKQGTGCGAYAAKPGGNGAPGFYSNSTTRAHLRLSGIGSGTAAKRSGSSAISSDTEKARRSTLSAILDLFLSLSKENRRAFLDLSNSLLDFPESHTPAASVDTLERKGDL